MRNAMLLCAAALALIGAKGGEKGEALPLLLSPADLDPALILPPPPAEGGRVAQRELGALEALDRTRTPDEATQAKALGSVKSIALFAGVLGPDFDLDRFPATRALFEMVRAEEKAAIDRAKAHFQRLRPYRVDASLHPCSVNEDPRSSYPSGHATMAYAMATTLARLIPSRAPAIMARAAEYRDSRLMCEQHYPSDVAAGQTYGAVIAERLLAKPSFRTAFTTAAAELGAAGLR